MARAGINKAVVNAARQALIARGEHPSIDAVRIEMGNTGSKTTIHRYLKEIEARQPLHPKPAVSLSSELGELVGRLAERLEEQAQAQVETAQALFDEQLQQLHEQLQASEQARTAQVSQLEVQGQALANESQALLACQAALQTEQTRNARLNQAHDDLQVRLLDRDQHIASLEEKHQHARDALEHYRQSVKDQRDQDVRRHEGQLQDVQAQLRQVQQTLVIRQDEATGLNRDNERLIVECRQAREAQEHLSITGEAQRQAAGLVQIELARAQGARDELLRQVSELRASAQAQALCVRNLEQQLHPLEQDNLALKAQLQALQEESVAKQQE